ncbi:MAG: MspA family porin [Mycobacteriaceae bacterium]
MKTSMMRSAAIAAVTLVTLAGPASADPADPAGPDIQPVAGVEAAPPADDGKVASTPPITDKSPDGWIMTVGGRDEVQLPVPPLTTAISTREYQVSGTFTGSLKGPGGGPAKGVLEVGYQIGCGIDMTTGNGVIVSGNIGGAAGIGVGIRPSDGNDFEIPSIGANIGGGVAVSLKPGLVNILPVTRKTFVGTAPWVGIHKFRIKIDGCVGESFIRSYATLAKSNDDGDGILSWYGITKNV